MTKYLATAVCLLVIVVSVQSYRLGKAGHSVLPLPGFLSLSAPGQDAVDGHGGGSTAGTAATTEKNGESQQTAKSAGEKETTKPEGLETSAAHPGRKRGKIAHAATENTQPGRVSDREDARNRKTRKDNEWQELQARAQDAIQNGDYEAALALLANSIEQNPNNPKAYAALAQVYRNLGMTQEQIDLCLEWASQMPDSGMPHYLLARAYDQLGYKEQALSELAQFSDISSGNLEAYSKLAQMYRQMGMVQEEQAILASWASEAPMSPDAHRALADYYRRTGELNQAVAEYATVVELQPGNANAYVNLGDTYQRMGLWADAQAQYAAALEINPSGLDTYLRLASSYQIGRASCRERV